MEFEINRVATTGCEIRNETGEIIGWSVDEEWGRFMIEAMKKYAQKGAV